MNKQSFQHTVMVVDDTPANIDLLSSILNTDYQVKAATSGEKAIRIAQAENRPDLILLDIMMPGFDGFETLTHLQSDKRTKDIPVIFVTALSEVVSEAHGLDLGAVDYITKPFNPVLVKSRVRNHIDLKRHRDDLESLVVERTREVELIKQVTILAMGTLAEYRDPETGGHIQRTQNYVKTLAEHLSEHPRFEHYLDETTIDLLYQSAPLHDIGKVGVPDSILLKPGKLTDEEFEVMKRHAIYGRDSIRRATKKLGTTTFLDIAADIAEHHHEKWDGSGYPHGLKGEDIPIAGRLMALADVYDALRSKRVYKPAFSHEKTVQIITEGKGRHFDPDVVAAFLALENRFREIALEHADFEEEKQALRA